MGIKAVRSHMLSASHKAAVGRKQQAGPFVLMFDESLNQATKKKQMDVHIRYWDDGCVRARYLGSQFLGHGRAEDLLHHIKECGAQLKTRQLMSVSTDGPNVNFKLVNLLQKEHAELDGGAQLVLVGSCGLHTLHKRSTGRFYDVAARKAPESNALPLPQRSCEERGLHQSDRVLLLPTTILRPQVGLKMSVWQRERFLKCGRCYRSTWMVSRTRRSDTLPQPLMSGSTRGSTHRSQAAVLLCDLQDLQPLPVNISN
ncbi:hypothetical protein KUCAC02_016839 [Chaenocephalus aceratus]|nr:hypothetical protein KUCAC02_016839 [Chaenocephalus aceratus]